jgi:hypothetical protein
LLRVHVTAVIPPHFVVSISQQFVLHAAGVDAEEVQ